MLVQCATMEELNSAHQAPIKALKCRVLVMNVPQVTIVQTLELLHLYLVLKRDTALQEHPFQRPAQMVPMQLMVSILRQWNNIAFLAKLESIVRVVNTQMIIDVMLDTSVELELRFQMIRICYVQQVFTVKKEVLNQPSAAMVHSQLQVQRLIKTVLVVLLVIIALKVLLKRLLAPKVHTVLLELKVPFFVQQVLLAQVNFRYQLSVVKLAPLVHYVM